MYRKTLVLDKHMLWYTIAMGLGKLLVHYIEKTKNYSVARILIEFTLLSFLGKLAVAITVVLLFTLVVVGISVFNGSLADSLSPDKLPFFAINQPTITEIEQNKDVVGNIFDAVIFAPLLETFLFQFTLFLVLGKFIKSLKWQVLLTSFLFALGHIQPFLVMVIFPAGFLLTWCFYLVRKRTHSKAKAYIATVLLHACFNGLAIIATKSS